MINATNPTWKQVDCARREDSANWHTVYVPVSEVASRQHLRSVIRHQLLLIQRYRLSTFGRLAFPTFWNSLADELRIHSKPALKTYH